MSVVRSRWAAVGAAVAVSLGAGGLLTANADGAESLFVGVEPTRVLDTRIPLGLSGPVKARVAENLDMTGTIAIVGPGNTPTTGAPVPVEASGVVLNVTVVAPTATAGFVSVRPGGATGTPSTSNINFTSPGVVIPNAVTVQLPASGAHTGEISLFLGAAPGTSADLLVDVVGYYTPGGAGVPGPKGDTGDPGPKGDQGDPGPVDPDIIDRIAALESSSVRAAPPCFDNTNRYVDCGNGTVHDQVTGLIWLKDANCLEGGFLGELHSYFLANTIATAVIEHGECGLTDNSSVGDWRLPTGREWRDTTSRAQDLGCGDPKLTNSRGTDCFVTSSPATRPFSNVQTTYWSSESIESDPTSAFSMDLSTGTTQEDSKLLLLHVWPVRDK